MSSAEASWREETTASRQRQMLVCLWVVMSMNVYSEMERKCVGLAGGPIHRHERWLLGA